MREIDAIAARCGGRDPEWMDEKRRCAVLVPFLERDGGQDPWTAPFLPAGGAVYRWRRMLRKMRAVMPQMTWVP